MIGESRRYFLQLAYQGTKYCGWQRQPNATTVQEVLEMSLAKLVKRHVHVVGSSRTDAGVHAQQQFAHVDLPGIVRLDRLRYQLNAILPADIAVTAVWPVKPTAHARYDALSRVYAYVIVSRKTPFHGETSYLFRGTLDLAKMNEAAAILCRKRQFRGLCRVRKDDVHFLCTVMEAGWWVSKEHLIFRIKANRFLRSMVRVIVGLILRIGQRKLSVHDFELLIDRQERDMTVGLAPAKGLSLVQVVYPPSIFLSLVGVGIH